MSGDELDRLIDRALDAYVAQAPPPGLEGRILLRARRDQAPRPGWWWAAGCAIAACALLSFLAVRTLNRPLETLAIHPVWRIEAPPPTSPLPSPRRPPSRGPRLTPAQRALLKFVQQYPDQALEAFAKPAIDEISIPPLTIEQLEVQEEKKQ